MSVKFRVEIPSDCRENAKKILTDIFFDWCHVFFCRASAGDEVKRSLELRVAELEQRLVHVCLFFVVLNTTVKPWVSIRVWVRLGLGLGVGLITNVL